MAASAMAVTPVVHDSPVVHRAQTIAYDLTATMDATASPLSVYGSLISTTIDNLSLLGSAVAANPAPLLRQVVENQLGYAAQFGATFEAIPTSLQNWYNGTNGKVLLDRAQAELEAGNVGEAYRWFNHSMLYAFQGAFGPLIAPGFILSGIPRGGTEYLVGIPEQIAQNVTNLVAATFTSSVVVSALFQGAFATVSGPAFELARIAESLVTSVSSGEALNVVNILANTPGILVNAALNGFDYADPDPETGQGGFSEWPALLTFAEPGEQGGVRVVAGLLQNLLVNLPKTFADAIDNTPEVVPAAVTVQRIAEDVTVAPVAELTESVTEAPAVAGPAVETAKLVSTVGTVESEAPAAEVEAVKAEVEPAKAESVPAKAETAPAEASPAETEQAVVDSTPAASTGADAEGAVKSKTKVKVTDRIKAKISEAKEARQAKLKAAKEAKKAKAAAKAEAKAAKAAAKDTKSNTGSESKGSGESKGGSDSSE
ncbi:hypothetical protein [Mycolicibacterium smegmatis]|uniref:PE-PGRS family protein n=1 Tax=Mycolicibacterium smegmatis (strain ATCC 700084 / mc(2)155) TaxID=246196 RepID=I7GFA9_MYCS2|nr:hypothetical protein [Mycolicibacterium smegmatis]AFP42306.1 hypothetical protein MSMEI_5873 [Mycolicibacterium smegmatis MC2 155]AIU11031.1 hypothetical protein LJ00_29830 [Mycolicibacterium smegmatis MC2 155]AIU17655.1 hypothetical protein LI99_29835 [Mycolicibacterium smegmatis]AIU24279.1 hypothetical protein LI98_29840 [Mycolicibacterium smegmatis]MBE9619484.1 hypothetical protein [Mycolicibacterium smegmatis]